MVAMRKTDKAKEMNSVTFTRGNLNFEHENWTPPLSHAQKMEHLR
jgi:hypothetical protein